MSTKAEMETILRWDMGEPTADLYTAYSPQARRWEKLGYPVEVYGQDRQGHPTGWRCQVPKEAVNRFRRLVDGQLPKRAGHGKGKQFESKKRDGAENHNGAENHDQLVTSADNRRSGRGKRGGHLNLSRWSNVISWSQKLGQRGAEE